MGNINKAGILGAGMMGAEIGLCFAMAGFEVVIKDQNVELVKRAKQRLGGVLDKMIQKGKYPSDKKEATLARLTPTDSYKSFENVEIVVEAVFEDKETKKTTLAEVDRICKPGCIIATNTSSIPITLLATALSPERRGLFAGAHFFSPASVMKLVEVIPGVETKEETISSIMECCRQIGKTPIRVKDVAGFVVNRILHAMWIEANRLLEEEVASAEDIDLGCKLGLGHPIGPYALMDLTENSLNLKVQEVLYEAYGERFKPRPILKQKVYANHLGRKVGRGWFKYEK
ncbi:MAG: 3-hydroxyacyl-CoA dehydrogenase family protein [Thermodesulfobacteriota bacterium]|jgi:3-hydroxybutyryl-CoA dehydrogenase